MRAASRKPIVICSTASGVESRTPVAVSPRTGDGLEVFSDAERLGAVVGDFYSDRTRLLSCSFASRRIFRVLAGS